MITVSVAESLTGGHLSALMTSKSGASNYYKGGITTYQLESKSKLLGVDYEHAKEVDCVSSRVAKEMSKGVSRLFNTRVGMSTTGYAGKTPDDSPGKGKSYAYISLYDHERPEDGFTMLYICKTDKRIEAQKEIAEYMYSLWVEKYMD